MSPAKRKRHKHLRTSIYIKHGSYFFVERYKDDNGKEKQKWRYLCREDEGEHVAMAEWSKLIDKAFRIKTVGDLLDRYMLEIAPKKAPGTYKDNRQSEKFLRDYFGAMFPQDIKPLHVYKYIDIRSKKAPIRANREKALLSHVFSYGIRWGIIEANPCRGVKGNKETPRDRYVEHNEYNAVKKRLPEIMQIMLDFAYITGQRRSDIMKIRMRDINEEGIYIEQGKGKKKLLIVWSDELRSCVNRAKAVYPYLRSLSLFPGSHGDQMTYSEFRGAWDKARDTALEAGEIKESFTFHDIRAKTRSDAEDGQSASELLGHSDTRITERVYNRKAKRVKPIK